MSWVSNLRTKRSVLKNKPPGKSKSVRTKEHIARVREFVLQSPQISARKHSVALGVSRTSLNSILPSQFNFHPNKMIVEQKLKQGNPRFCLMFSQRL